MIYTFQHSPLDPAPLSVEEMACDLAPFDPIEAALQKGRAVQERADRYAREMRAHGFVWDMERKIGRYVTTEHKVLGFQAGLIVGALIGAGAAIVTFVLLARNGGGTP